MKAAQFGAQQHRIVRQRMAELQSLKNGRISRPLSGSTSASAKTLSLVSIDQVLHKARISGGTIDRGDADWIDIPGPIDVLVSGGTLGAPVWVYVEWDMDTLVAEIPEIAMATRPVKEGRIYRRPLCSFYSTGSGDDEVITLKSVHHDGDIFAAQIAM